MVALLSVAVPALALTWKRKPYRNFVVLASVAVASHILLDLTGYTPVFYPLVNDSFRVAVGCDIHYGSVPALSFNVEIQSKSTVFTPVESLDAPLFMSEGLLISLALLAPAFHLKGFLAKRFRYDG